MLTVSDLTVEYGPVRALAAVSLHLERGSVGTVIGSNGAGKSTLLRAVSGLVPPVSGRMSFDDHSNLQRLPAHQRPGLGIAHVLEGHRVFGDQSVNDNLVLGALRKYRSRGSRAEVMSDVEAQYDRFPALGNRRRQTAATLSGGEQQMLAIAVALMSRPSLLLLDEPSLGLAPKIVEEIFELITQMRGEGLTILLVEQLASLALQVADVGWVLQRGEIVAAGPAPKLLGGLHVREAYLGVGKQASWDARDSEMRVSEFDKL